MKFVGFLALGFYHMQSAHDRDDYVTIVWDKISPGKEHNFNKYTNTEVTHFNTTYDYYSVMHYGPYGFSTDGSATIVPVVSELCPLKNEFNLFPTLSFAISNSWFFNF